MDLYDQSYETYVSWGYFLMCSKEEGLNLQDSDPDSLQLPVCGIGWT